MCLRLLRAEVWSSDSRRKLNRVTARLVPSSILDTPAVIAHGRIVVLGGDQHRLHEEVIVAGGSLKDGRFTRLKLTQIQAALDGALDDEAPGHLQVSFKKVWSQIESQLMQSLEARMRDRSESLKRQLDDRAEKEIFDLTKVMEELQQSILKALSTPLESDQMALFSEDEREQKDRDIRALEARLREIPSEITEETKRIKARFANPVPRLFPLLITFLAPQSLVGRAR
jgi:hypothetical protein